MDYDTLKAIQIIALDAIERGDYDAFIRKVQRWYSREFSTPLSEVEAMATEKLLAVYYEDLLESLYDPLDEKMMEKYNRIREEIMKTKDEQQQTESEDDEWVRQMNEEVKASTGPRPPPQDDVATAETEPEIPNIEERTVTGESDFDPTDIE